MSFVIRGRIGENRLAPAGRVGQFTYLAETGDHFFIWDGVHKAAPFRSAESGFEAASECNGPWFNMPDPATIECIEWQAYREMAIADEAKARGAALTRR